MISDIILIGPVKAGKSTLAKLLSARLGLPRCSLDRHLGYYREAGYDESRADRIISREGLEGVYRYRKPFDLAVVERVLAENDGCVFDFGACHSVYEDARLLTRARGLLRPYRNVVLVMPSRDAAESVRVLKGRGCLTTVGGFDLCVHFVKHPANFELAKFVVYTEGKTPEESRDEILSLTGLAESISTQGGSPVARRGSSSRGRAASSRRLTARPTACGRR
ncbi:MAG: shikimate kinase [Acidobacteriota bacterium]|nr:shikimate kinase [Acidobacteriota bacterium]